MHAGRGAAAAEMVFKTTGDGRLAIDVTPIGGGNHLAMPFQKGQVDAVGRIHHEIGQGAGITGYSVGGKGDRVGRKQRDCDIAAQHQAFRRRRRQ